MRVQPGGREIRLPEVGGRLRIGSSPENDIVIDDAHVSAVHCVLERRDRHQVVVRDQRSTNGTWLDGVRVTEGAAHVGARVMIGRSQLAVVGGTRPAGDPAAAILGQAPALRAAVALAERAARTSHPILLYGESGSGKELFARLVHERSRRPEGPLVAINCGALPDTLIESELFGHERGAFTGAAERRAGVFEQASGGTLFLDEIGELPTAQQPKLLRVLESGRVRRLGALVEQTVDVRVVTASHRRLADDVASGRFRLDLYHRLAAIEVAIPPLRERPEDIPELAEHVLLTLEPEHGQHRLSPEALTALVQHDWPGNVRELRHVLMRAVALTDSPVLGVADVMPERPGARPDAAPAPHTYSMDDVMRTVMQRAILRHGSQRRAAAALQMPRSTFNERAHRYGLSEKRRGPGCNADGDEDDAGPRREDPAQRSGSGENQRVR